VLDGVEFSDITQVKKLPKRKEFVFVSREIYDRSGRVGGIPVEGCNKYLTMINPL